jgi:ADP-heptose:LPS heptosyltransferase
MISTIKQSFRLVLFSLIDLFIFPTTLIKKNHLLLIRLDGIGDYIIFRNFIEILKRSEKYKDYRITLIGDIAWKSLSEELDSDFVDEFIWIDRIKFGKKYLYRYKILQEITKKAYEVLISPTFSRNLFTTDWIVKLINANRKIGSIGDPSNITKWQKKIGDKYYTICLPAKDTGVMFEFYRNKEFFENLLKKRLEIDKPYIDIRYIKYDGELPNNYVLMFIGAGDSCRKWSVQKLVEVAKYINNNYDLNIVLAGGIDDIVDANTFDELYDGKIFNLVGKTSLMELLKVISKGKLLISNETSAPHFGVALANTSILVISNGNYFGRFAPYPKEISQNYHVIYHPEVEKYLDNYKKLSNSFSCGSRLDINEISIESVIKKIDEVLK